MPIAPPNEADAESTSSRRSVFGRFPRSSVSPPPRPTATAVPTVSKKSVMKRAKMTGISDTVSASARLLGSSPSPIVEKSPEPGASITPSGPSSTPKISPAAVAATTPRITAPLTRRATSTPATPMPNSAISGGPVSRSPRPMPVAGLLTTMPPSRRPTSVMKRPMPAPIESFNGSGTARMIAPRSPAITSTSAIRPSITITDIATGHSIPRPSTMSNATTALMPSPGASANGRFVNSPMASVVTAAAIAVATATAANGMLAADRIAGLTNRM